MLDHGDIKLLKVFLAVVDHGSMSAAGAALHRSSAAVSESVSKLEAKLGFSVLVRTPRGCRPTPLGRELVETARALLDYVDNSLASITDPLGRQPSLNIGSVYGIYNELINELGVNGYRPAGVSMTIDNPGPAVIAAEVDLAIMLGPTSYDDQLVRHYLFAEPRVAVVSRQAVPAGLTSITLDELDELTWPAIPSAADETYLKPWLCYDERGGPPPKQTDVSPEPFALFDWMLQAPDRVVPTIAALAGMFSGIGDYVAIPIVDTSGWKVDLVARKDAELPVEAVAAGLIDMRLKAERR